MKKINLLALFIFAGLLVWVFRYDSETTRAIQAKVMSVFSPFTRTGAAAQDALTGAGEETRPSAELQTENEALKLENARLRIYEQRVGEMQDRLDKLNRYFKFSENNDFKLIAARILVRKNSAWSRQATLNKGSDDGIQTGSPVILPEGLVGRIAKVSPGESEILFITDELCKVAAQIEGTSERGILQGVRVSTQRRPDLRLRPLPSDIQPPVGRKVFTWANSNNFPPGLLLGTIVDFHTVDGAGEATVQPAVPDLDSLKYVFVMEQVVADPPAAASVR